MAATVGAVLACAPLAYLVVRALEPGLGGAHDILWRDRTAALLLSSLALVAAVTATCVVLGTATAWVVTRTSLRGRGAWLLVSALPLAVPSYVAAYGWLATVPGTSGFVPAWLILSAVSTPYVTLPVAATLRACDPAVTEVARSLGLTPWQAWRATTAPQIAPAAAAGGLLVGLYALSDFGAVSMLRFDVFTFAISRQYGSFLGRDTAALLAVVLVVVAVSLVALERSVRTRGQRWMVGGSPARVAPPVPLGRWTLPAVALVCLAPAVAVAVPVATLFARLAEGTARDLDPGELTTAVLTTAAVAAAGAALTIVLAVPIGALAARHRGRLVTLIESAGYAGHALPGIVVALSLVFVSLSVVPALYQSTVVLVVAYAVLFLPKAIGATRTAVELVPPVLAETARSQGRGPARAFLATTGRLASPGVAAGALLVMLTAMKELPATLLLRPTGLDTLPTEIWSRTSAAAYGAAAPYALALVVLAGVPAMLLTRVGRREDPA